MTNEEMVLEIQAYTNMQENKKNLYLNNTTLIRSIIKPYVTPNNFDDLMQESYFGLIEAIEHYDILQGTKFMTFAKHYILKAVRNYIRENERQIRLPQNVYELLLKYKKYCDKVTKEKGQKPSRKQIKAYLNIDSNKLGLLEKMAQTTISLQSEQYNDEGDIHTLIDIIQAETDIETEVIEEVYQKQLSEAIHTLMDKTLSNTEKDIIYLLCVDNNTAAEVAQACDINIPETKSIYQGAMAKLRKEGRGLYYRFLENESMKYHGSFKGFKAHEASIVERIAMDRLNIDRKKEKIQNMCSSMVENCIS